MTLNIVQSYAQLAELKAHWEALAALRKNPLLDYTWFHACARALHDERDLNIVTVLDKKDEIQAIAPLVKTKSRFNPERLEVLGAANLAEPVGFLYRNVEALQTLYAHIAHQRYPIVIQSYWPDSTSDIAARPRSTSQGRWISWPSYGSGVLEIKSNWESYLNSKSSKRRYDFRRALRHARAFGGERYSIITPTSDNFSQLLDLASDIEDRSWKARKGSSIRSTIKMRRFLQLYTEGHIGTEKLKFLFLYLGEEAASMAICAQSGDALWFIKIGYDEKFKACSPGILLLGRAFDYCFENGLTRIEHLGSYESWLSPWTTYIRPYTSLMYYPVNFGGIRALAYDALHLGASRANRFVKQWQSSR